MRFELKSSIVQGTWRITHKGWHTQKTNRCCLLCNSLSNSRICMPRK